MKSLCVSHCSDRPPSPKKLSRLSSSTATKSSTSSPRPIRLQKRAHITDADPVGSIYFNTLFPMGIDTMIEAVDLIKAGNPPRIVQDESKATYEAPCRDEHAKIDFSKPARTVFNLIRGCDPQPGAFACLGEKRLRIYGVTLS